MKHLADDIDAFDLEFAKPHAQWVTALYGSEAADSVKPNASPVTRRRQRGRQEPYQAGNARLFRARLFLQTGKATEAEQITAEPPDPQNYPSGGRSTWRHAPLRWHAWVRMTKRCEAADEAERTSRVVEVRVLAAACRSIVRARAGDIGSAAEVLEVAQKLGAWDPVVCASRAASELARAGQARGCIRRLGSLYSASNDLALPAAPASGLVRHAALVNCSRRVSSRSLA